MKNEDLDTLNDDIKQLRVAYEKYFAGVERIEPSKERDRIKKELRRLQTNGSPNTARRFRTQQLIATFVTYENHWTRICRQIEEGTYKRDLWRAQKITDQPANSAVNPAVPPSVATAAGTVTPAPKTASYPDAVQQLHDAYCKARANLGQPAVAIESLAKTVQAQTAAIKKQYGCKTVEFRVALKDNKVILKAVPRS